MNGDAALNLLMARLGSRSNATLRANALLEMQLAQDEYYTRLGFTPWFLFKDYTAVDFVTVVEQEYVDVPADYLMIDEEWGALYYQLPDDTNPDYWTEILPSSYNALKAKYKEETVGAPLYYDIVDNRIYLRKIPDAAYPLRFQYYAKDTAPADTATTNLWLSQASSWLIAETGFVVASLHVKDVEAASYFDNMRNSAKAELYRTHVAREAVPGDYRMGANQ